MPTAVVVAFSLPFLVKFVWFVWTLSRRRAISSGTSVQDLLHSLGMVFIRCLATSVWVAPSWSIIIVVFVKVYKSIYISLGNFYRAAFLLSMYIHKCTNIKCILPDIIIIMCLNKIINYKLISYWHWYVSCFHMPWWTTPKSKRSTYC